MSEAHPQQTQKNEKINTKKREKKNRNMINIQFSFSHCMPSSHDFYHNLEFSISTHNIASHLLFVRSFIPSIRSIRKHSEILLNIVKALRNKSTLNVIERTLNSLEC